MTGKIDALWVLVFCNFCFENSLQNYFLDLRKIQTASSVFNVYFNAGKSRYQFGCFSFEAKFWSLGIKVILPHREDSMRNTIV